jgi:flagellar hook-basal body complex protein FliE
MRYTLVTGLLIVTLAGGVAVNRARNANGQESPRAGAPVPTGTLGPGLEIRQTVQAVDQASDELAELNSLDARLADQAAALVKQVGEMSADKKDEKQFGELRQKLHDTLERQFDTQQKVRELEVAGIEAKVKKLRDVITRRNDARRSIIDKRFDQLLSEADGLGWNSPAGTAGYVPAYAPWASSFYGPAVQANPATKFGGQPPSGIAPVGAGRR